MAGMMLVMGVGSVSAGESASQSESTVGEGGLNLNFRRIPLNRVLDYLSKEARIANIRVTHPDKDKEEEINRMIVTVQLQNVTWKTALQYIAKQYKLTINDSQQNQGLIYLEQPPRITLDLPDAPIEEAIKLIAAESGKGIVISDQVTGNVNFRISDVPWEEALDSVLKTYNYVKVVDPNGIIRITTPSQVQTQLEVRSIQLRYIQPQGAHFQPELVSETVTGFVSRRSSPGGGDLEQSLLTVLDQIRSEQGSVTYESRTNMLILKDTATNLNDMEELIAQIDRQPKQVKIKAHILSTQHNPTSTIGVDWFNADGTIASISGPAYQTSFPFSYQSSLNGNNNRTAFGFNNRLFAPVLGAGNGPISMREGINEGITATSSSSLGNSYVLGTLNMQNVSAILKAIQTDEKTNIVQAPEIVALNNQEATIFIGEVRRYLLQSSELTDGGTSTSINERELLLGVQLLVVPHICGDTNNIILEVVPKEESTNQAVQTLNVTGIVAQIPGDTQVKIVHTRMMLRSGETGVIGGLLEDSKSETMRKVPILGDIPIIKALFRTTTKSMTKTNTIILMTPVIMSESHHGDFQKRVDKEREFAEDYFNGTVYPSK
jgi:type IV pilus assembly protein PilQ